MAWGIDQLADALGKRFEGVSATDIAQTVIAGVTLIIAPVSIDSAWKRFRYSVRATLKPRLLASGNFSRDWLIDVSNQGNKPLRTNIIIYAQSGKTQVVAVSHINSGDGGADVSSVENKRSSIIVNLNRLSPGRTVSLAVTFSVATFPVVESPDHAIGRDIRRSDHRSALAYFLSVAHSRTYALMVYFGILTALLIAKIAALGLGWQ